MLQAMSALQVREGIHGLQPGLCLAGEVWHCQHVLLGLSLQMCVCKCLRKSVCMARDVRMWESQGEKNKWNIVLVTDNTRTSQE